MKLFFQTLILCIALHANAQHIALEATKDAEYLDIAPTTKLTAKEFVQNKTALSLPENHSLELVSIRKSRNGYRQYRYQQTYKGIPIEGADCIVHEKDAQVKKIRSKSAKNIQTNTQALINESIALQAALHHIGAIRYAWQDESHETQVKKVKADAQATFYPTANLVFFNPNIKSEDTYRLAYRFDIYAITPMRRAVVYIDAYNGQKLAIRDLVNFADEAVSGISSYHGEVDFTAHKEGNKYIYKNEIGGGIEVLNSNNTESYPNNDIIETDNFFDQDPMAVDVLSASEKAYEYFRDVHQWQSFDDADMPVFSWIHYGENYPNAFWNGSWMTYGDGNGSTLLAPTSMDIVVHEYVHGITSSSAGLVYSSESGALSESFSDIFGEIIEASHDPDGSDWIAGGDIVAVPGFRGSRNLADPKDPTMLNRQPNTYAGEFWYNGIADFGGVHTNNGVQNHWFYLLAHGGSGVNDNGYAYNIQGIGVEKAAQITFDNLVSLLPYDGFAEARMGAIAAAEMLYGADSDEVLQTIAAWCAVGVGDCYEDDCSTLDSLTLVELYHATDGENWTHTWDLTAPMSTWYGVTLNATGCAVKLEMNVNDITGNNLTGHIPNSIGNLRQLIELHLNNNHLTGGIPPSIGNLESLEILNLRGNGEYFSGYIPAEIGQLGNLRILNLSFNHLTGPIPDAISELDNLTHLQLNSNPISGAVPAAFGGLSSLIYLDLSYCNFTGAIPAEWGNLINLTGLILNDNFIVGPIPNELSDLPALNLVNLRHNALNFGGLESLVQAGINDLVYNPQDSTYILTDENGIYVNAGGTISNNYYTWYKDGVLLTTIVGDNRLTVNEPGRYRCEVINEFVTNPTNINTNFVLNTGEIYVDPANIFDCRTRDSLALVAIYNATDGENWLEPWNLNEPIDLWVGIVLGTNGCVANVDLMQRNLHGALPPEIGDLTYVREFEVSFNYLTYIGPEIGNLTNLTHLQLNTNSFNQEIPSEIGNLINLVYLNISHNYFYGEVPATFSNLNNLNEFGLHDCRLEGTIPPISNLRYLYIENNRFYFDAPEYWTQQGLESFNYDPQDYIPIHRTDNTLFVEAGGTLANNTYIWYKDEQAVDTIYGAAEFPLSEPGYYYCYVFNDIATETILLSKSIQIYSVSDLTCRERDSLALVEFYHATNGANWTNTWDLTQAMHTWYGVGLSNTGCVDKLDLRENALSGTLPNAIGDFTEMRILYLQYNGISGQIPYQIGNLTNLEIIDLGDNNLTGEIPDAMSNMMGLIELSLQRNELSGTVPDAFWNKSDLEIIRLYRNHFTGTLPSTIGELVNVRHFGIGNNNFSGQIPPEIGQMRSLKRLSLFGCNFTGNIPPEIANLSQLTEFIIFGNEFIGTIPPEFANLQNLEKVRISNNKLSGYIPFNLEHLNEFWLDRNYFNFNQIEDWVADGAIDSLDVFRYAPQLDISIYAHGDTLYTEAGGTLANNTYHWYKNDVLQETIQGNNKYVSTTSGSYHCEVTNAIATQIDTFYTSLRLKTESIYVETSVWPGDFNANGTVEISDVLYWGFAFGNIGPARPNASPNWLAQLASQWASFVNNINGKHQDGDGNGTVDEQDLSVFQQNFGNTRANATPNFNRNESPYVLSIQELSTTPNNDGTVTRNYGVYLNSTNGLPVSLHGIDFTLEFITSSNLNHDISVSTTNSFLAPDELVVIKNDENTELNIAATRTDRNNQIGEGIIFEVIVIIDDVSSNDPTLHVLTPKDVEILSINTGHEGSEAQLIPVSGETFSAMYMPVSGGFSALSANAVSSPVECNTPGTATLQMTGGYPPYQVLWSNGDTTTQISTLEPGIYTATVTDLLGTLLEISTEVGGQEILNAIITQTPYGAMTAEASGGTAPYTYLWNGIDTTMTTLPEGTHLLEVIDAEGCQYSEIIHTRRAQLRVILEGAYDTATGLMQDDLRRLDFLPSTDPYTNSVSVEAEIFGIEGNNAVVDWLLVEVRDKNDPSRVLSAYPALLQRDGDIMDAMGAPLKIDLWADTETYIAVRHRNHFTVVSPQTIDFESSIVEFDFTTTNSLIVGVGEGQRKVDGRWMMFPADVNSDQNIDGADKGIWSDQNGAFGIYSDADINMDGDINGNDKGIWFELNGTFSGTP